MIDNNQPTPQDVERGPVSESADIEQEQGYTRSEPGLGRVSDAGEVNEREPAWRPGDEPAGSDPRYQGEEEPGPNEADHSGDADDILSSRGHSSGSGGL